jgi:adenosylhomocysteine nucleosidase
MTIGLSRSMRSAAIVIASLLGMQTALAARQPLDDQPRIAVISAFEPEYDALSHSVSSPRSYHINGMQIVTGTMEGKRVVLMMSGISMVNAAMNTQLLLDRFQVSRIVFSGIAGGIDPLLKVGDVVVPDQWAEYLESVFARKDGDGFKPENFYSETLPNYGMIHPNGVRVGNAHAATAYRRWFKADAAMVALASVVAKTISLRRCTNNAKCLDHQPRVLVGGGGVSGPAFMDNADYRRYLFDTFHANVLDMESAAVGHVAFANEIPFIVFRSLSDLAGGGDGANQMGTFMGLASANSATIVRAFVKALPR